MSYMLASSDASRRWKRLDHSRSLEHDEIEADPSHSAKAHRNASTTPLVRPPAARRLGAEGGEVQVCQLTMKLL